jgi:glycosyltransferase involved in cell wall biosynthesis
MIQQYHSKNLNVFISILKYPPDFTGAGQRIHRIYRHLKQKGIEDVFVLTTTSRNISCKKEIRDGIQIYFLGNNQLMEKQKSFLGKLKKTQYVLSSLFRIVSVYRRVYKSIDVVHTIDSSWLSTVVAYLAYLTRKPLVKEIVLLGSDDPLTIQKKFFNKIFLFPFHYARHIVVISDALKDACIKAGFSPEKVWSRPNPVYISDSDSKAIKTESRRFKSAKKILWVGKINPRKNIEFLIESGRYLKGQVTLTFIGPSHDFMEYTNKLIKLARDIEFHTQKRIKVDFIQSQLSAQELSLFYKDSDLFWFASHKEGMGNVVAEALVYGTPVITLPVDGIMHQLLKDPADGQVVDTNHPQEFAKVVNEWLLKEDIDRLSISQRAKDFFNPETIENGYLTRLQNT